jgi:hypothetical protein
MSCNGNNHPPWCDCSFQGGNNNQLSGDYYLGLSSEYIWVKWCESSTVLNVKCPVCNADVFYYSNNAGSKVYFDSLGTPWPIHPCFNKETLKINKSTKKKLLTPSRANRISNKFVKVICQSKKMEGILIFDVQYGSRPMRFYCKCSESIEYLNSIKSKIKMEVLTKDRMRFQLGSFISKKITGYASIEHLKRDMPKANKRDWELWDSKLKSNYGTALAEAMESAIVRNNKK